MEQFSPLDRVIKKVAESDTKNLSPGQILVRIDKETGKAVKNKSLFGIGNFLKDIEYYIVSIGTQAEDKFTCKNKIVGAGSFSLIIEYQVSCEEIENAEKVTKALCLDTNREAKLENKIEKYVRNFVRKNSDEFINDFSQAINDLKKIIRNKVETELFLAIDCQISLDESKLKPFLIESQHLRVLVKDCNEELDIELRAELIVDPNNRIKAISNYEKRNGLSDLVKETTRQCLFRNISLQEFYYELKTSVYEKVKNHLNEILANLGFQIKVLSINTNEIAPPNLSQIEQSIVCKVQEYSELVVIKNRLQMIPNNISKYRLSGSPSLKEWVKIRLEEIILKELFSKSIDILFDFESSEESKNIKKQMKIEAQKIGYNVEHITSDPELKFDSLTKDFEIEDKGTFAIKNSSGRLEVKLNIIVTAKIEKLEKIKNYLKREISVDEFQELIKTKINDIVRQNLRKVEPERYYLRFDFEDDKQSNNKTVEQELKEKITEVLKTEFSATVNDIVLQRLDTEVSELHKDLFRKGEAFELEVQSKWDYGETVKFSGYLQVGGVGTLDDNTTNGWYTFQNRMPSFNDIKSFVLDTLQQKLPDKYDTDELMSNNNTSLQKEVSEWANKSIIDQFGLEVTIKNWKRPRTENENDLAHVEKSTHKAKIINMERKIELVDLQNEHKIEAAKIAYQNKLDRQKELYGTRDELEFLDQDEVKNEIKKIEQGSIESTIENVEAELEEFKKSKSKKGKYREIPEKNKEELLKISESEKQKSLQANEDKEVW